MGILEQVERVKTAVFLEYNIKPWGQKQMKLNNDKTVCLYTYISSSFLNHKIFGYQFCHKPNYFSTLSWIKI